MTKKEILAFLELPELVQDKEIAERLLDKAIYFKRLHENAPNEFLRNLHLRNMEKVKVLQEQYGTVGNRVRGRAHEQATGIKDKAQMPSPPVSGWLIRHTERQPIKKFMLRPGKNPIGRDPQLSGTGILIENDDYVSRRHAMIYVESNLGLRFFIEDSPEVNGGKVSKNGTYINGSDDRITERTFIEDNDTIQVGLTKFVLRLGTNNINSIVSEVEESSYMKTVVINIF